MISPRAQAKSCAFIGQSAKMKRPDWLSVKRIIGPHRAILCLTGEPLEEKFRNLDKI